MRVVWVGRLTGEAAGAPGLCPARVLAGRVSKRTSGLPWPLARHRTARGALPFATKKPAGLGRAW